MPGVRQFDLEDALDGALETFWEHGYDATSMTMLLERMGIQKGSFYATFKSKRDVLLAALERYASSRAETMQCKLSGGSGFESIERMFDMVVTECRSRTGRRGCLVVNLALELSPEDDEVGAHVRASLADHEAVLADLVARGQAEGDIHPGLDPALTAKSLLGQIIAMRVYVRAGFPRTSADAFRNAALALLNPPAT